MDLYIHLPPHARSWHMQSQLTFVVIIMYMDAESLVWRSSKIYKIYIKIRKRVSRFCNLRLERRTMALMGNSDDVYTIFCASSVY